MCDLATVLSSYNGIGYVVAPAGFGKTHLIAEATARSNGRQLILTHTYAGVNALGGKMRALGVSDKLYRIDTIASWSLRLALSYSATSEWTIERPADNDQWNALYDSCSQLLDCEFIRRIVRCSYKGLYVDEYQDCSTTQHGIVCKLARDLPCRILGDPLQGIFDFAGQNPIYWVQDIEGSFENLGTLNVPHRWIHNGDEELGAWLQNIRAQLEAGEPVDLSVGLPASVNFVHANQDPQAHIQSQSNTCRYFQCDRSHRVIAIHKGAHSGVSGRSFRRHPAT